MNCGGTICDTASVASASDGGADQFAPISNHRTDYSYFGLGQFETLEQTGLSMLDWSPSTAGIPRLVSPASKPKRKGPGRWLSLHQTQEPR